MAVSKYAKYVVPAPIKISDFKQIDFPMVLENGADHLGGMPFTMAWAIMKEPFTLVEHSHNHPYNQAFLFMGSNIENIREFDAEIWVYFGEEQEKIVITEPSMVWIPGWMMHCPLVFHRVGKPFQYMDFMFIATPRMPPVPKASQR